MKMGTAQKQNIAIQHRIWNQHPRIIQPMTFKEWLLGGIEHYKKQGFTFEVVTPSLMRISRPDKPAILRTCENFREEYENEYLAHFKKAEGHVEQVVMA